MIGKAASGWSPKSVTTIMQGAYSPMPTLISAPSTKFTANRNRESPSGQGHCDTSAWQQVKIRRREYATRNQQRNSHRQLDRRPRHAVDHARADPSAERRGRYWSPSARPDRSRSRSP